MQDKQIELGLVSTIIPVFNRADLIIESVRSVLEQDYHPFEVIVVDDGSTDNTREVLGELAAEHAEVTILRQANGGPGAARELGRQYARGEYIQYHDSDDLLLPGKFRAQVAALVAMPECDVAYGKTERISIGQQLEGVPLKESGKKYTAMFPASLRSRWWSTSTPLFRRSVTDLIGPWMTTRNEEDWEYECRIAASGGRLAFVDQFVSVTRSHHDHLTMLGATDTQLLKDRCIARQAIYKHATRYSAMTQRPADIELEDWQFFAKSVFLLARECAAAGMAESAEQMIELSVRANRGPNIKHRLFVMVGKLLGWKNAARIVSLLGK